MTRPDREGFPVVVAIAIAVQWCAIVACVLALWWDR